MACTVLSVQTAACTSGIGLVRDPIMLRQIMAQLACEVVNASADMAFAPLANLNSVTSTTTFATPSYTPTSNALLLVSFVADFGLTVNSITGNGLTWSLVKSNQIGGLAGTLYVYRALGSAPTTGPLTVTFSANSTKGCLMSVVQFSGCDTSGSGGSGAIVQSSAATTPGITLAALNPSGRNAIIGFTATSAVPAIGIAESGWVQICNFSIANLSLCGSYQLKSTDNTYVSGMVAGGSVAAEIKSAT